MLHDADVEDPSELLRERLRQPPYLLILEADKDAAMSVRRLSVALVEEAKQLPLANASLYEQLM